jgi:hypothetical protein
MAEIKICPIEMEGEHARQSFYAQLRNQSLQQRILDIPSKTESQFRASFQFTQPAPVSSVSYNANAFMLPPGKGVRYHVNRLGHRPAEHLDVLEPNPSHFGQA